MSQPIKTLGLFGLVFLLSGLAFSAASDEPVPIAEKAPRPAQASPQGHESPPRYLPVPTEYERVFGPPRPRGELFRDGFQSVQVNVDENGNNIVDDAANEPTIAVDPNDPNRIVIGWRQFDSITSDFREAGWAYSRDNGRSWTFPGVLEEGVFRSDPVLAADPDGNFYYYSLTTNGKYTCQMFKSTDRGLSWIGPIPAYGGDKAWMDIDRTGGVGDGNIYCAWDYAGCCGDNWFTRSTDGGMTYLSPIPIPQQPYWGTVAVGPDGELYICGRTRTSKSIFYCVRSLDAKNPAVTPTFDQAVRVELGGSLEYYLQTGPNPGGLLGQVWVAVNRSAGPNRGHVYILSSLNPPGSDPLDVHFIRSTDGGKTWSSPLRVNDDPVGNDAWQWYGTMSVAPNGRIDVIWNDTRNGPNFRWSEVFYTYSNDEGRTWEPSVAITPAFDSHLGWPQQNKLGDYYDMISDDVGADLAYAATFNGEQDVYFVRIGDYDCNGNGVPDPIDIATGTSTDFNKNGIPDECEDIGDLDCDGDVDFDDIDPFVLALSGQAAYLAKYPDCEWLNADINGDTQVDFDDIDPFVGLLSH